MTMLRAAQAALAKPGECGIRHFHRMAAAELECVRPAGHAGYHEGFTGDEQQPRDSEYRWWGSQPAVRQQRSDGCMQAAIATLLNVPPSIIPEADTSKNDGEWWQPFADGVLRATGYELLSLDLKVFPRGFWVAIVPRDHRGNHALVMRGEQVAWDTEARHPIKAIRRRSVTICVLAVPTNPAEWTRGFL